MAGSSSNIAGKTFCVLVFGCQMNRNDAELVRGLLSREGAIEVEGEALADIVVFMTCCVREKADTRIYGQVSSLKSLPVRAGSTFGRRIVAVGGCIGQRDGEKLAEKLPNVDVVFGTHNIEDLPSLLEGSILEGGPHVRTLDDRKPYDRFEPKTRESSFHAWLPIMKGCNNFCTYCIVPYVRGREMSRTMEDIAAEARMLVDDGVKEITLLGQNVNSYGRDLYGEPKFAEVLRAVADTGVRRLRFVTSHPKDLGDDTIRAMAELDAVMPYLHLPVQSGSNRILKAMNRVYTVEHYLEIIDKLRDAVGDIALSTDIITGFPGETEEDFEQTYELVEKVGYSQVFTFIYSKREGTPAAKIEDDTPREVIQERFDRLVDLVQKGAYEQNQKELGQNVEVLVEGVSERDSSKLSGKSPKNQTVHFPAPEGTDPGSYVGRFVDVHVDLARTWYLSGTMVQAGAGSHDRPVQELETRSEKRDADLDALEALVRSNIQLVAEEVAGMARERRRDGDDGDGLLPVVVVAGPTGVGKSNLAELLAAELDAEIVSADSMQVYRHMDIGTAKVKPEDRGVPYHCIDIVDPGDVYSASLYQRDARAAIEDIRSRGRNVVVCGGTGLYIRAALDDMDFPAGEQVGNEVRDRYERYAEENGAEALHALLAERDPESAALIHPNNVRRVVRAFEMLEEGRRYCDQVAGMKTFAPCIDAIYIGLTMETCNLYAAVDGRVDGMMREGLLDEVRWLVDNGYRDAMTSMQAIGYKEFMDVFDGKATIDEAVESVKRSTRRYSKRQRTWFKRDPRYVWYKVDGDPGSLRVQDPQEGSTI